MYQYNPFGKNISKLTAEDLLVLKDKPEGWHIEYKRESNGIPKIAKSITSFANSYGGWIFYGIEENQKKTAGNFVGISKENINNIEIEIQRAVSSHSSPPPYFEIKIIYDHDKKVISGENAAIIAIYVPQSNNTPHVHSSGCIYRRVADASDPKPETDRHYLDLLWQRGKDYKDSFSKFITREVELCEAEENTSVLRLFLITDLWDNSSDAKILNFDDFFSIMQSSSEKHGGIKFDNIFSTSDGFVARHVEGNLYHYQTLSWRYYNNGISEITFPLNTLGFSNNNQVLYGYENQEKIQGLLEERNIQYAQLFDLSYVFSVLYGSIKKHKCLLQLNNKKYPIYFKACISGVWRKIPFLDLQEAVAFYEKCGFPIIQDDKLYAPHGITPDTLGILDGGKILDYDASSILDSCIILNCIAQSMGIPYSVLQPIIKGDAYKMVTIGQNAMQVTRSRMSMDVT